MGGEPVWNNTSSLTPSPVVSGTSSIVSAKAFVGIERSKSPFAPDSRASLFPLTTARSRSPSGTLEYKGRRDSENSQIEFSLEALRQKLSQG